jgi:hypothetical protein
VGEDVSGLTGQEAAVMYIEGVRAGVNLCLRDLLNAADALRKRGMSIEANLVERLTIPLQEHLPKEKP